MNYKINWLNLTESEAREILEGICDKFKVLSKTENHEGLDDVSYLQIDGIYNENAKHSKNIQDKENTQP
jgi:hypothetical protein